MGVSVGLGPEPPPPAAGSSLALGRPAGVGERAAHRPAGRNRLCRTWEVTCSSRGPTRPSCSHSAGHAGVGVGGLPSGRPLGGPHRRAAPTCPMSPELCARGASKGGPASGSPEPRGHHAAAQSPAGSKVLYTASVLSTQVQKGRQVRRQAAGPGQTVSQSHRFQEEGHSPLSWQVTDFSPHPSGTQRGRHRDWASVLACLFLSL